jgi:hypothetical protein
MGNKYDKILGDYREEDSPVVSGYVKLDQTIPQEVINGAPIFSAGLDIGARIMDTRNTSTDGSLWQVLGVDNKTTSGLFFKYYTFAGQERKYFDIRLEEETFVEIYRSSIGAATYMTLSAYTLNLKPHASSYIKLDGEVVMKDAEIIYGGVLQNGVLSFSSTMHETKGRIMLGSLCVDQTNNILYGQYNTAGVDLNFASTTHATKGKINFGAAKTSYFDEVTGDWAFQNNITAVGTVTGLGISGTVLHGATAATARPTGYANITWIGSVEPDNAENNDVWIDTTE